MIFTVLMQKGEPMLDLKIGDEVYIHGFVDEIRKNTVIIRNEGGYFGTVTEEIIPSAQPEPQWIPCSERLPEDLEEVNVTWVNHKPEPYYYFVKGKPFTASAVYYKGKWFWYTSTCADLLAEYGKNPNHEIDDAIEITAWMPLPEPWRGEQHEL